MKDSVWILYLFQLLFQCLVFCIHCIAQTLLHIFQFFHSLLLNLGLFLELACLFLEFLILLTLFEGISPGFLQVFLCKMLFHLCLLWMYFFLELCLVLWEFQIGHLMLLLFWFFCMHFLKFIDMISCKLFNYVAFKGFDCCF